MTRAGWRIAGRWAREAVLLAVLITLFSRYIGRDPWARSAAGGVLFGVCVASVLLLAELAYAAYRRRSER